MLEAITPHRRYAFRDNVRLRKGDGTLVNGLLIEMSLQGCRISKLDDAEFSLDESVTVEWDSAKLKGRIRWAHRGIAGIMLAEPLSAQTLAGLLARTMPDRKSAA